MLVSLSAGLHLCLCLILLEARRQFDQSDFIFVIEQLGMFMLVSCNTSIKPLKDQKETCMKKLLSFIKVGSRQDG